MIRVRIQIGESVTEVRGKSVESIARTHFGRRVEVQREHDDAWKPTVIRYTVLRYDKRLNANHVLGIIVEYRET